MQSTVSPCCLVQGKNKFWPGDGERGLDNARNIVFGGNDRILPIPTDSQLLSRSKQSSCLLDWSNDHDQVSKWKIGSSDILPVNVTVGLARRKTWGVHSPNTVLSLRG